MNNIIVVPAKKHSERFPDKNFKLFDKHIDVLKTLNTIGYRIIIITDDERIQNMCENTTFEVIDRPDYTCWQGSDTSTVLRYIISKLELDDNVILGLYELTHLGSDMIESIVVTMHHARVVDKSVLGLTKCDFYPEKAIVIKNGKLENSLGQGLETYQMTSQCLTPSYLPKTIASPVHCIKELGSVYNKDTTFVVLDTEFIDIDYESDLK